MRVINDECIRENCESRPSKRRDCCLYSNAILQFHPLAVQPRAPEVSYTGTLLCNEYIITTNKDGSKIKLRSRKWWSRGGNDERIQALK